MLSHSHLYTFCGKTRQRLVAVEFIDNMITVYLDRAIPNDSLLRNLLRLKLAYGWTHKVSDFMLSEFNTMVTSDRGGTVDHDSKSHFSQKKYIKSSDHYHFVFDKPVDHLLAKNFINSLFTINDGNIILLSLRNKKRLLRYLENHSFELKNKLTIMNEDKEFDSSNVENEMKEIPSLSITNFGSSPLSSYSSTFFSNRDTIPSDEFTQAICADNQVVRAVEPSIAAYSMILQLVPSALLLFFVYMVRKSLLGSLAKLDEEKAPQPPSQDPVRIAPNFR